MDISEEGVTCLNIVYSFFFFYCLLGNQCVTRVAERAVMQLTQKKYKAVNVPGHKNTAAKDSLAAVLFSISMLFN